MDNPIECPRQTTQTNSLEEPDPGHEIRLYNLIPTSMLRQVSLTCEMMFVLKELVVALVAVATSMAQERYNLLAPQIQHLHLCPFRSQSLFSYCIPAPNPEYVAAFEPRHVSHSRVLRSMAFEDCIAYTGDDSQTWVVSFELDTEPGTYVVLSVSGRLYGLHSIGERLYLWQRCPVLQPRNMQICCNVTCGLEFYPIVLMLSGFLALCA
jgi:hypothetical protein